MTKMLFDGHRFREIARLVNVRALVQGDVIREQLKRNRMQDRREHACMVGHRDDMHAFIRA